MKILVVYESSYGNTHLIADAIAEGIGPDHLVDVVAVANASKELVERADLLIVGGPTHAHGMSREQTRHAAVEAAQKPGSALALDPDAEGAGLREWFDAIGTITTKAVAFDTRMDAPVLLTGRASKGISRQLRQHGCFEIAEPKSFLVTKATTLVDDQQAVARRWGEFLADRLTTVGATA